MTEVARNKKDMSIPFDLAKINAKKIFDSLELGEEEGIKLLIKAMDDIFSMLYKKDSLIQLEERLLESIEYINDFLRGKPSNAEDLYVRLRVFESQTIELMWENKDDVLKLQKFLDSFIDKALVKYLDNR